MRRRVWFLLFVLSVCRMANETPDQTRRSSVERSGAILLVGRLVQLGSGFLLSIVLVRLFGFAAAGTYAVAGVMITLITLVCTAGLQYSLPRESLSSTQRNGVAL